MRIKSDVLTVWGLTALAAVLRLIGLGQHPLWYDEIQTVAWAGIPSPEFLRALFFGPGAPAWRPELLLHVSQGPLFMGLAHLWSVIAGSSEAALRLLPALFAIATIPPMMGLADRMLGRKTAVLTGVVLAVSPFHIWYAQELRGYSLVMLCAVVATILFLDLLDEARRVWRYVIYGVSLLVGFGANFTMGFVFVVHALIVAARLRTVGRSRVVGFVAVWLAVTVAAAPWLGDWAQRRDVGRLIQRPTLVEPPKRGATTMPVMAVPYTAYVFSVGYSLGPATTELHADPNAAAVRHWSIVLLVALVYGSLAVLGIREFRARNRPALPLIATWLIIPFAMTAWLAATNVKVWNPRYVSIAFPAFVLLVSAGLRGLPPRPRVGALLVVVGLSAVSIWNLRMNPAYAKEDYRAAAAYLDASWSADDAMIGVGAPSPTFFYSGLQPESYATFLPHRIGDEMELRRRIEATVLGHPRVWLLKVRTYLTDPQDRVGEILSESRRCACQVEFNGIELERYDLPP